MGTIKKLAGETVVYGFSTIFGRLLNYALVPIHTNIFAPADYGVVTELMSYAGFFNVVFLYGMETGFFRFASIEDKTRYFNNSFSMVLITSLVFSIILFSSANGITSLLNYQGNEIWIYLMVSIFFVDAVSAIPFAKLRLEQRALNFAGIKLTGISITVLLNLFFLLGIPYLINNYSFETLELYFNRVPLVTYIFLSNLIGNTIVLLLLFKEIRHVKLQVHSSVVKKLLRYSLPILIIGLAGMTNENLSRLLIKHLIPVGIHGDFSKQEVLGIFGACYKLSIFMTLAVQAFRFASEPFFFSKAKDRNAPEVFSRVMTAFVIFGSLVIYFISINLHWIASIFLGNPDYLTGIKVVPILLCANMFLGIYYTLSVWYKLTDKTIYGAYMAIAGAVITIIMNTILIPKWGYMGSAIATLTTYLTMSILSISIGRKYFPIPYELGKILTYILFGILTTVLALSYMEDTLTSTIAANFIGLLLFITLIFYLERDQLRQYFAKTGK